MAGGLHLLLFGDDPPTWLGKCSLKARMALSRNSPSSGGLELSSRSLTALQMPSRGRRAKEGCGSGVRTLRRLSGKTAGAPPGLSGQGQKSSYGVE